MLFALPFLFPALLALPTDTSIVNLQQDGIEVEVSLEPIDFLVGDTLFLQIKAIAPDGIQLALHNDETFGSFTIVDTTTLLDIPSKEGRIWNWSIHLDTFDASTTALDGIALEWTQGTGEKGTLLIDSIPVTVNTILGEITEETSIRSIKEHVPLFSRNSTPSIIVSSIAFCSLCLLLFRFSKGKKQLPSPHVRAMADIANLKNTNFEVHSFYTSLSDIVRHYLEGQFKIAATGQTTREFLNAAKQNNRLEHFDRESLGSFLVAADLVKFAKHEPGDTCSNDALKKAELFIEETSKVTA
ncbi:MAG TPA: hypothetical protein EYO40_08105 [Phycisphaerales bacterium]|nr:hypothetical protein [Phycisphaerales bacterium]